MSYRDIEPGALAELMAIPGLTIIDQRDAATRLRGELVGALPATEALIARLVRQRRANPPVLVYCYHGNQSRDLCTFLAQLGLQQVFNLAGGWKALQGWQAQQPIAGIRLRTDCVNDEARARTYLSDSDSNSDGQF